jgi:hypothetical protein
MLSVPFYYALLALCWIYALRWGGSPERIGATALVVGSVLTLVAAVSSTTEYGSVEIGVFLVDVATLVAFLALALRAERYWTLWIAALQLIGTAGHAVKLMDPNVIPRAYAFVTVFWSYPMLLLIMLGTYRHQQRLKMFGVDKSWSSSWRQSGRKPETGPTI